MNDARTLPPSAATTQVLLCMIWGLGQVAAKVGNTGISPIWQAALRSIGATLLLVGWIAWRGIPLGRRGETLLPGTVAGVLFGLEFTFLFVGLVYTTAVRAVVMLYSAPFFVALGAHFFVPGDRLSRNKLIGLAAAFAGLVLAFADRLTLPDAQALIGDLLCLAGAVMWGATTVVIKATALRRAPPETTLLYQLAVSALLMSALSYALDEPGVFAPTPLIWSLLAFQIVVVGCASLLIWFYLVSRYRATTLHAFTFLTPLFGVIAGSMLLGEPVGPVLIGALALIAAGIVLVNRG
ncbi:MAG: DMT family transporter [Burkholderiaceae bacterium]|nr:DMT family transporter [Burkholderiaceae bacterium]